MKNNKTNFSAIDGRIYKYRQAWFLAFFSSRLYVDVAKNWKGYGLTYFLLVITIVSIPFGLRTILNFQAYYRDQIEAPIKKIPNIAINNGKLDFAYPMPYLIKDNLNNVAVIIDDKRNLREINSMYPEWIAFITSNHIFIRMPTPVLIPGIENEKKPFNYDEYLPLPLNNNDNASIDLGFSINVNKMQPEPTEFNRDSYFPIALTDFYNHSHDFAISLLNDNKMETKYIKNIENWYFDGKELIKKTNFSEKLWRVELFLYPSLVMFLFGTLLSFMAIFSIVGKAFSHIIYRFPIGFKRTYRLMLVSSSAGVTFFMLSLGFENIGRFRCCPLVLIICYFFFALISVKRDSKNLVLA